MEAKKLDGADRVLGLVGLDIGGTKTHAVRWAGDELLAEAVAGSANVQGVSVETARLHLAEVFAALGPEPIARVIAGAGGVDTEADAQRLRAMIAVHAPDAQISVVHDTRLILAAGRAATGIAVILGTGSAAWGIDTHGNQARSGGWGYVLGDEASGYWMAREAVRQTLRAHDLGRAPGTLGHRVLSANQVSSPTELIALFHHRPDRHYWAAQSPLVFAALAEDDAAARQIIETAVEQVCSMVADVTGVLGISGPVVIGGGLARHQPVYRELLGRALWRGGQREIRFLDVDPVHGARFIAGLDPAG